MKKVDWHFNRTDLALKYLRIVYQGAINRIALLDVRRTGKTSFLLKDFFPTALEQGFVPIYINLWSDPDNPALTIRTAIEKALTALSKNPKSTLSDIATTEVKKLEVGSSLFGKMAVEFSDKKAKAATQSDLIQISETLARLAAKCGDKAILIIDEIQHLATSPKFDAVQRTLRTALDTHSTINLVYSGSSRSGIDAMFSDKDKAFFNSAFMIDFPRLDHTFVQHCRDTLQQYFNLDYNVEALCVHYDNLDQSPFWLMQLMSYLMVNHASLDEGIEFINAAIIEDGNFINKAKELNKTDIEVLFYILAGHQRIYSDSAIAELSTAAQRKLTKSTIQGSVKKLKGKHVITHYGGKFYIELPGFIQYLKSQNNT
ncbi:MAG: hypothetical protein MJK04_25465 [Psychrosphaera sp.]|nr:hypothetical protein [Psychrosphaera sp.]